MLKGKEIRAEKLFTVMQGKWSTAEYTLKFHTLAAGSRWSKPVWKAAFCQGLNFEVLKELVCHDNKVSLESLIDLSICLHNLVRNRQAYREAVSPAPSVDHHEPLQLGQDKLTCTEREKHTRE